MRGIATSILRLLTAADVFEFDPYLSRSEKMKLAFGVARKRLEELQKQRKARLPTSLEQRLGSATKSSPSPDRRPSNTMQTQVYAQDPRERQNSQAFAGLEDSTNNMSLNTGTNGDLQNFSYNSGVDLQQPQNQGFNAQGTRLSSSSMMGSQQVRPQPQSQNQFQDVDWVCCRADSCTLSQKQRLTLQQEDFDRLFPLDESGNMYNPQLMTPNDLNAGMTATSDTQPMTFFPGPPAWQQQQQPPQSQPQWQY